MTDARNIISEGIGQSRKINGRWSRSTQDWIRDQGPHATIREMLTIQYNKNQKKYLTLEYLLNVGTKAMLATKLRPTREEDWKRRTNRRFQKSQIMVDLRTGQAFEVPIIR